MTTVLLLVALAVAFPALRAGWRRWRRRGGGRGRSRSMLAVIALMGLQLVVLAPQAYAAGKCEAPNPEIPGAGMVGALDPPYQGKGAPDSPYQKYGYAGMVWHVYDCDSLVNPQATIDTWAGNELFNVGKNVVGATNSLHYTLLGGDLLKPLDKGISAATKALYEGPYVKWLWLPLLLLGLYLFRNVFSGDLAAMSKRGMYALAALTVAAAAYAAPLFYTHLLDDVLIKGTSQIQAGFLPSVGVDQRNGLPTALHKEVVYKNWLRGEFGTPDAPQAEKYGPKLLDAQAFTKKEAGQSADQAAVKQKKDEYKRIYEKLGNAQGYFAGTDGSRTGDGMLAAFQGFAYGLFPLLAKAAILLGQVLMRVVVLAAPLIGFIAVLYHDLLRRVGHAIAAVLFNVVVLAVLSGLDTKLLMMIFDPGSGLALLTQVLLAALITAIFLVVGRPIRRMRQMVEMSVGAAGMSTPQRSGGRRRFLGLGRRREPDGPSPQESFWDTVRSGEVERPGAAQPEPARNRLRGRRVRPEMSGPVMATAQRLDRDGAVAGSRQAIATAGGARGSSPGALRAAYPPGGYPGPAAALPEAGPAVANGFASRRADTVPVTGRGRREVDEEPVVVPSRVTARGPTRESPRAEFSDIGGTTRRPRPRRAEQETVGGKPVFVLYRPSRGLEVRDTDVPNHDSVRRS